MLGQTLCQCQTDSSPFILAAVLAVTPTFIYSRVKLSSANVRNEKIEHPIVHVTPLSEEADMSFSYLNIFAKEKFHPGAHCLGAPVRSMYFT